MAASLSGPVDSYKPRGPARGVKLTALGQCVFHCQDLTAYFSQRGIQWGVEKNLNKWPGVTRGVFVSQSVGLANQCNYDIGAKTPVRVVT